MNILKAIQDLWDKLTAPKLPNHVLDDLAAQERNREAQDSITNQEDINNTTRESPPPAYEGNDIHGPVPPSYEQSQREARGDGAPSDDNAPTP